MNNSVRKNVDLNLGFLSEGDFEAEIWEDTRKSDKEPKELNKRNQPVRSDVSLKVTMAKNGGFVAIIKRK